MGKQIYQTMRRQLASIVTLALISSGCQFVDQITGAPKKLNDAEAAVRYLEIACESNALGDKINERMDRLDKEGDSGKITGVVWAEKTDALYSELADMWQRTSDAKTNPEYVWPDSVSSLIKEMAAAELESVSATREFLRDGGYKKAEIEQKEWPDAPFEKSDELSGQKASAIRSALRLPARGEGCKDGKVSVTIEEMKKRQKG